MIDKYCTTADLTKEDKFQLIFEYIFSFITIVILSIIIYKNEKDRKFLYYALSFGILLSLIWETLMTYDIGWKLYRKKCQSYDWTPRSMELLTHIIIDQFIFIVLLILLVYVILRKGDESMTKFFSKFNIVAFMLMWGIGILQEFLYDGYMNSIFYFPPNEGLNGNKIGNTNEVVGALAVWIIVPIIYYFMYILSQRI